jgi:hypothetical protein
MLKKSKSMHKQYVDDFEQGDNTIQYTCTKQPHTSRMAHVWLTVANMHDCYKLTTPATHNKN